MDFSQIDNLAKKYGTPYYIMEPDIYLHNIKSFVHAFKERHDKIIVGYSFKTNYVPALCRIAKDFGCYAEVVSEMEYVLAKEIGFKHIIFNGPIKKEEILLAALDDEAIINVDSYYELETILKYRKKYPEKKVCIGLRINIDLTNENGVSKIQSGLRVSRFGFSFKMLEEIIPVLNHNGISVISLHGHTSSSDRAVKNYALIVSQMLNICEKYDLCDLKYFDVGGGFFGAAPKGIDITQKPSYCDYANEILDILLSNAWFCTVNPYIVIEPGVSVVANVFSYVAKVFQYKEINGKNLFTTDGSVFDVKPTMHKNNLPFVVYTKNMGAESLHNVDIVGSTCMEKDIIMKDVDMPSQTAYGDYIKIDGVGAYTISLTPTFINFLCPIIEFSEDKIELVRRRQTLEDIISLYK